ncbi:MAG: hypothetical protein ABI142_05060, partial [Bryocella sp.]
TLQSGVVAPPTPGNMLFVGEWDTATAYNPQNVVTYSGSTYVSLTQNSGSEPQSDDSNLDWRSLGGGGGGSAGPGYLATSATSLAIASSGSVSFTTQAGLAYSAGGRVRATSTAAGDWMEGVVSSYSGPTLAVTMDLSSGSGTHADWNINLAGEPGSGGGGGGGGSSGLLQSVRTEVTATATVTATTIPFDNTIPQITEGAAVSAFDTTITPQSASSRLRVRIHIAGLSTSITNTGVRLAVFRDSGANAVYAVSLTISVLSGPMLEFEVSSGSTTATTFTLRCGVSSNVAYFNSSGGTAYFGGVLKSAMTIDEIL